MEDRRARRGRPVGIAADASFSGSAAVARGAEFAVAMPVRKRLLRGESRTDIARQYGSGFAEDLVKVEPGRWAGPLQSGLGMHVVLVRELDPVLATATGRGHGRAGLRQNGGMGTKERRQREFSEREDLILDVALDGALIGLPLPNTMPSPGSFARSCER